MALAITTENFPTLSASGQLVVIDFWAPWCGPCRQIAPIVEEVATEYEGKAIIGKCDTDENKEVVCQLITDLASKGGYAKYFYEAFINQ